MIYGMRKTTIYLPEDLKLALDHAAASRGRSVADLVREALQALVSSSTPPRPRVPLFSSGHPRLAERVDEALAGFGDP